MRPFVFILLACLVFLSACTSPEYLAKKATKKSHSWGEISAFGEFTLVGEGYACLSVSKNDWSGKYTVVQQALLEAHEGHFHHIDNLRSISHELCVAVADRISQKSDI